MMNQLKGLICLAFLLLNLNTAAATFYDAGTLAGFCTEHIKFSQLEPEHDRLAAGICQGYLASKIEVMTLSQELCQRETLNLDQLAADLVAYVAEEPQRAAASATRGVVEVLQANHACLAQ